VRGTRGREVGHQVSGDATLHAQQDAGQERGLGVGQDAGDGILRTALESIESGPERIAPPALEQRDLRAAQQRVHSLPGQVVPIGKIREFGRGLQQTANLQPVAVTVLGIAGGTYQGQAAYLVLRFVFESNSVGLHAEIGVGGTHVWLGSNDAGEYAPALVVVGDQGTVVEVGLGQEIASPAQEKSQAADAQQPGAMAFPP